jgi:IS605 OrfB family transposase
MNVNASSSTIINYKKTFQYRLNPRPEQLEQIEQAAGAVRFVYNWGTDLVRKASEKREPIPNYYLLAKCLTHLKREPDKLWLKQSYNATLQNSLKDLDLSVKAFFREIKKKNRVGLPGFRKKGFNDSMRFSVGVKHAKDKFYIPKIGFVDYYNSRPLEGTIKQATVCKIIDKWFINVVCDVPNTYAKPQEDAKQTTCFISLGAGFLDKVLEVDATIDKPRKRKKKAKELRTNAESNALDAKSSDNNGGENQVTGMEKGIRDSLRALCQKYKDVFVSIKDQSMPMDHQMPNCTKTLQGSYAVPQLIKLLPSSKSSSSRANRLLIRRQKKLSRCIKNSKNREKARQILEKQHLKIRRRRHDFLHKLSHSIVSQYDYIAIKKYELKRMMLSAYTPLAKVLRDKAWDKFIQYIKYKSAWYGKNFVLT